MKNYKELIIWQKGIEIVKQIYSLIKHFPKEEKYGIISQLTRAAISIPANIAEGSSRNSDKDYARFLQLSLGSALKCRPIYSSLRTIVGRRNKNDSPVYKYFKHS